jgi:hypothetical protein
MVAGRDPARAAAQVSQAGPSSASPRRCLTEPVRACPIQIGWCRRVPGAGDHNQAALPLGLTGKRAHAHLGFVEGAGGDVLQWRC